MNMSTSRRQKQQTPYVITFEHELAGPTSHTHEQHTHRTPHLVRFGLNWVMWLLACVKPYWVWIAHQFQLKCENQLMLTHAEWELCYSLDSLWGVEIWQFVPLKMELRLKGEQSGKMITRDGSHSGDTGGHIGDGGGGGGGKRSAWSDKSLLRIRRLMPSTPFLMLWTSET